MNVRVAPCVFVKATPERACLRARAFEDEVNELDSESEPRSGKDRQKMRGSWSGTAKSCFCVSPF